MDEKTAMGVTAHNETLAQATKPGLADPADRRESFALNLVENPLTVRLAI